MFFDRGSVADYDRWETLGSPGWGWDGILPFFKKVSDGSFFPSSFLNRISLTRWHSQSKIFTQIVKFKQNITSHSTKVFTERMVMFNRITHHSFGSQPVRDSLLHITLRPSFFGVNGEKQSPMIATLTQNNLLAPWPNSMSSFLMC